MASIFNILSSAIRIYSMLCFLRIIISWFPGLIYTGFGRFLCTLTDPFLNLFRKIPLRIGMLDFSPMLAFLVLSLCSSVLANIQNTGRLYLGGILANLIYMLWQIFSSILSFLAVLVLIRLVVILVQKNRYNPNSMWNSMDGFLGKITYKFIRIFTGNRMVSYTKALLLFLLELILLNAAGSFLIYQLVYLITRFIPL